MSGGHAKSGSLRGPAQHAAGVQEVAYKPRLLGGIGKACPYCSHQMEAAGARHVSREHILPRVEVRKLKPGLRHQIQAINCIVACRACNEEKASKTLYDYMLFLVRLYPSDAMRISLLIDGLRLEHPPHIFLALTGSPA